MTIMLEVSNPPVWKPGLHKGRQMYRVWWLWFAVVWLRIPFYELVTKSYRWVPE